MADKNISMAVIRRLPKYYRYLGDLLDKDIQRISSKELSTIIGFTASQIRQDLNNFGGFGQQGYGYNVKYLHTEIGKISKELSSIQNTAFGFLGEDTRYDSLYEFVKQMLKNLLSDAEKRNIDILHDEQFYLSQLENEKHAFETVCDSSLVHWDMWEGNVFVKDGHVSGVIDWERALWGEPYMDDRFRMHNRCNDFLEGFGKTIFEENEITLDDLSTARNISGDETEIEVSQTITKMIKIPTKYIKVPTQAASPKNTPANKAITGSFAPQGIKGDNIVVALRSRSLLIVRLAIIPGTAQPIVITKGITDLPERPTFLNIGSRTTATRDI